MSRIERPTHRVRLATALYATSTWLLACSSGGTGIADTMPDSPLPPPIDATRGTDPGGSGAATPPDTGPGLGAAGSSAGVAGTSAPIDGVAGNGATAAGVTYHKDIRPIIDRYCLGCHVQGGAGPFALDTWQAVQPAEELVVAAVTSGKMPPFPARQTCEPLRDAPTFSRDLFMMWKSAGFPEGDPADYVADATGAAADIGEPTILLDAGQTYTPPNNADDYHCFVLPYTFDEDSYITAMDILPDQRAEVHHVQIHLVDPTQLTQVQGMDAAAPASGYTCLAGTGVLSQNLFSWRPGGTRVTFDEGDAAFIAKGTSIVIQVHYNTQFLEAGSSPTPDQTKIALWTLPSGTLPDRVIYRTGVTAPFTIPAGDPSVVATQTSSMGTVSAFGGLVGFGGTFVPGEIIGMTPHAHQIASAMSAQLQHADGSMSCLVDVPEWNFHWQMDYLFQQGVPYAAGDSIVATCEYDNSAAHQPVVDGVQQSPRAVAWGEGSLDEMCLHYVWLRMDRAAFLAAR